MDLEEEKEVTCIATQGRTAPEQYTKVYEVSYSTNGHDWTFYRNSRGGKVNDFRHRNKQVHMKCTSAP